MLFLFSSRRRHTRLQGDWSSDVCSSDLVGFTCRVSFSPGPPAVGLQEALATEVGLTSLSQPLVAPKGWIVSSWLIGHAADFKLAAVSFSGQQWTASSGRWSADPTAGTQVEIAVSAIGVK